MSSLGESRDEEGVGCIYLAKMESSVRSTKDCTLLCGLAGDVLGRLQVQAAIWSGRICWSSVDDSYVGAFSDVRNSNSSGGSSRRRKCCWLLSGRMENSIPEASCVDMIVDFRVSGLW